MVRVLIWLVLGVVLAVPTARADDARTAHVALLPLDAPPQLEIYGQPVASEIARALVAGDVDVVVVGPKMAVPEEARVIVDGTITEHGDQVVLTVRLRNPIDGVVLATMYAKAPGLASIDKAAADLSSRVVPAVKEQLAVLRPRTPGLDGPAPPVGRAPSVETTPRPVRFSIRATHRAGEPLRAPLVDAFARWARRHGREPAQVEALPSRGEDLAIGLEIAGYVVERGAVPLARARVRARIVAATGVVFDRVIVTDTIVGDREMPLERLAERAAREVLDILRPHVKRTVAGWR